MTYVLIWVIFAAHTANNVAATGSAEFNSLQACQKAGQTIESQINAIRYINAIALCHDKGTPQMQ